MLRPLRSLNIILACLGPARSMVRPSVFTPQILPLLPAHALPFRPLFTPECAPCGPACSSLEGGAPAADGPACPGPIAGPRGGQGQQQAARARLMVGGLAADAGSLLAAATAVHEPLQAQCKELFQRCCVQGACCVVLLRERERPLDRRLARSRGRRGRCCSTALPCGRCRGAAAAVGC